MQGPVTILVDGNNVMGARPDGWWRDRAGAAARLAAEVGQLAEQGADRWIVVFDGRAPAVPPPAAPATVLHAGSGGRDAADDRIVALVAGLPEGTPVRVYTSDAGLRRRLRALGAEVLGARRLLAALAPQARDGPGRG